MKKIILLISFFITIFTSSNAQQMLAKIDLKEQVKTSNLIIEGKVTSQKVYVNKRESHIYKVNTIEILKFFKGSTVSESIDIVTMGGQYGDQIEVVNPSLQLQKGSIGVFMLNGDNRILKNYPVAVKKYRTNSGLQGFYRYDEYNNIAANLFFVYKKIKANFYQILTNETQTPIIINKDYVFKFQKAQKSIALLQLDSFSPSTIKSGTDEELTINGSGFGNTAGKVQFRNADDGGSSFISTLPAQIVSWNDTQVVILVPSEAGTGDFRVLSSSGALVGTSGGNTLTINSAESNIDFTNRANVTFPYRAKLVNINSSEGYEFTYSNDFSTNQPAVGRFKESINTWICATGINWSIATANTTNNVSERDGVNIVRFQNPDADPDDNIERNTLGLATSYFSLCQQDGTAYVIEVDMDFNSNVNWYYGEEADGIGRNQIDFQGTALHELGHAHNMGHVIDDNTLMHFQTGSGPDSATRTINEATRLGAEKNLSFSMTGSFCSNTTPLKIKSCPLTTNDPKNPPVVDNTNGDKPNDNENNDNLVDQNNVDNMAGDVEDDTNNSLTIFNNNNGEIEVANAEINELAIFDISGKKTTSKKGNTIPLFKLSKGVYILKVQTTDGRVLFKKFLN